MLFCYDSDSTNVENNKTLNIHVCQCKTCHRTSCDGLFEHYLFFMYCKSHRDAHDSVHLQHWFCVGSIMMLMHEISDKCGYKIDTDYEHIFKRTLTQKVWRDVCRVLEYLFAWDIRLFIRKIWKKIVVISKFYLLKIWIPWDAHCYYAFLSRKNNCGRQNWKCVLSRWIEHRKYFINFRVVSFVTFDARG